MDLCQTYICSWILWSKSLSCTEVWGVLRRTCHFAFNPGMKTINERIPVKDLLTLMFLRSNILMETFWSQVRTKMWRNELISRGDQLRWNRESEYRWAINWAGILKKANWAVDAFPFCCPHLRRCYQAHCTFPVQVGCSSRHWAWRIHFSLGWSLFDILPQLQKQRLIHMSPYLVYILIFTDKTLEQPLKCNWKFSNS